MPRYAPQLDKLCNIPHTQDVLVKFAILITDEFYEWKESLPLKIRSRIEIRLLYLAHGHFGDAKFFDGLIELRWRNGTRVYAFRQGQAIVVVLFGGSKHGQENDIQKSKSIRDEIVEGLRSLREQNS